MRRLPAMRRALAGLALVVLLGGGLALARSVPASADDSPTTTVDTTPVTTVTDLAPPTTVSTPAPRPDAAPKPAPARTRHSVTHVTTTHSSPAPVAPQPSVVRPPVHVSQPAPAPHASAPRPPSHHATPVHRKPPPAKPRPQHVATTKVSPPAVKPVTVVAPAKPASSKLGGVWLLAGVGLLLALGLVAALLGLRRRPTLQSSVVVSAAGPEEVCAVEWWHGYLRSQFLACTMDAYGQATVVAKSPFFRWRKKSPPPERGRASAAFGDLLSTLDRLGWQADGRGTEWFEQRFRRVAADVPASQPEPTVERRRRWRRDPVPAAAPETQ